MGSEQNNVVVTKNYKLSVVSGLAMMAGIIMFVVGMVQIFNGSDTSTVSTTMLISTVLMFISRLISTIFPLQVEEVEETSLTGKETIAVPAAKTESEPVAAPEPAFIAAPVQPESVTIFCPTCGQPMLIPSASGAFRVTCPKCGNGFIHTN